MLEGSGVGIRPTPIEISSMGQLGLDSYIDYIWQEGCMYYHPAFCANSGLVQKSTYQ